MNVAAPDWDALRRSISGSVVLPDSPEYDSARKPAVARFHDTYPKAAVYCESPRDVSEVISFVRVNGLPFVVRSGGHSFAGYSSTEGVVLDVSRMNSVVVQDDGTATVGAGAKLGEVYGALEDFGLTIPAGCGPDVGISGLALGGGLGILGRRHGLALDHLVRATVVLADGSTVECDEGKHEDLFWALRGAGGGNFGVVTSLTFRTIPSLDATSFHLAWPFDQAASVVEAWQRWSPEAPEELAASLLLIAPPEVEEPPTVNVFGAMTGGAKNLETRLGELIACVDAPPTSNIRSRASYPETKRHLDRLGRAMHGDPTEEAHPYSKSEFFRETLPTEIIAALVEHFERDRLPGQSRELDFTPWGGAYNRTPPDATAFVHRDARFLLKQTVEVPSGADSGQREEARNWLRRSWGIAHPSGTGGAYQNFPDPELDGWERAYYGSNLERLVEIKARYDTENFFTFPQSLSC